MSLKRPRRFNQLFVPAASQDNQLQTKSRITDDCAVQKVVTQDITQKLKLRRPKADHRLSLTIR